MQIRTWEVRAAAAVTLVTLAFRLWIARKVSFCGTPDSCYALGLAQALARRHAFQVPFIFDLQLRTLHLPNTGLEYWRPGVSLLLYVLRGAGAVTLHGSLVVTALVGVLWALAAWKIAMRATGSRAVALASYSLCLLLPPGWGNSLTPDPTLFYAAAVAWFLALFTVEWQGVLPDVIALLCVAAAYMIRNDAGLLVAPFAVVLWLRWREARRSAATVARSQGASGDYIVAMLCGFVLALVPMHVLYQHVLGTAFPPGASEALYLNDLSDFSNYGVPVSLHTMMSGGAKHLITMRLSAGAMIVYRVLALVLGYVALIFLPTLWVRDRAPDRPELGEPSVDRLPELAGGVTFAIVLLLIYSLVLPAVGVFSALRSSTALLPLTAVVVVVAIVRLTRTPGLAAVLMAAVVAAYFVSGLIDDRREIGPMNAMGDADRAQARELASMGAKPDGSTVVMTPDPVQFSVTTGYSTVPLAGNGLDAITNEALALHPTHAILDGEHLPGSSAAVAQKLHPVRTMTVPGQQVLLLELPPEFSQK